MKPKNMIVKLDDREIIFETGKIAKQANGSVFLRMGDTAVLATCCASKDAVEGADFLPLRVDYQERFSSTGKTVSGFIKREGRPSEREILVSRLIDRSLRPLFEKGYANDVQVLTSMWSYDGENSGDALAICAASAALVLSDIPFIKPIAGVRLGYIDGAFIVNPTVSEQKISKLDMMIAGSVDAILMIEGHCDFLTEDEIIEGIDVAHDAIKKICQELVKWQEEIGKEKNRETIRLLPEGLLEAVKGIADSKLESVIRLIEKTEREEGIDAIKEIVINALLESEENPEGFSKLDLSVAFKKVSSQALRKMVLKEKKRCDGRSPTDIRHIEIENTILPRTHGSSLFTRGETQSMSVCTLGGESSGQRFETVDEDGTRRFYLQYFFPPYSVGEVGRFGPPGRREVGHGKLAERALMPLLPTKDAFPYTIRLEANITESNGSSSMASVCGGVLSMMDAGVPIKRPISGIAMGLILEESGEYLILSDILGIEDALGDMDFKVTGDSKGITAFQMDIKVEGITRDIMKAALVQARDGRVHILNKMLETCPESKQEMSVFAPRIETIKVHSSKIATIIGPGGKQIRAIIEKTGVEIDIDDDGLVSVAAKSKESMQHAKSIIEGLVEEVKVGKTYHGRIASIVPFGAFVEILPGKEGLCHISELSPDRVEDIFSFIKEGEDLAVKVLSINERGQLKLSHRATLEKSQANS
jgi:polyribonucleotide nucleotidyltransferase